MTGLCNKINQVCQIMVEKGTLILGNMYKGDIYFEIEKVEIDYFEDSYEDPMLTFKVRFGRYNEEKEDLNFNTNTSFGLNDIDNINADIIYGLMYGLIHCKEGDFGE